MDINEIIKRPEYKFLSEDKRLGFHIILLGLGGSYAYGTNIETSDIDLRGIAVNPKRDILLGRDYEVITNEATDTTIYSIKKMFQLLSNCNPNTIEILGLEPDQYVASVCGKDIVDNKELFLSKRAIKTFGGYANQQMYRLQQKSLCALTKEEYNKHTARVLSSMIDRFNKKFNMTPNNIKPYVNESGDLMLDLNFNGVPAEIVSAVLSELNTTIRDYNEPSKRNEKAETHNKIAKHSMHLLRLYMMCIDILEKHEINTKRVKEHDLLMKIRNGLYLDTDGRPNKAFFELVHEYEDRFEEAKLSTTLPDNPDMDKLDDLEIHVIRFFHRYFSRTPNDYIFIDHTMR